MASSCHLLHLTDGSSYNDSFSGWHFTADRRENCDSSLYRLPICDCPTSRNPRQNSGACRHHRRFRSDLRPSFIVLLVIIFFITITLCQRVNGSKKSTAKATSQLTTVTTTTALTQITLLSSNRGGSNDYQYDYNDDAIGVAIGFEDDLAKPEEQAARPITLTAARNSHQPADQANSKSAMPELVPLPAPIPATTVKNVTTTKISSSRFRNISSSGNTSRNAHQLLTDEMDYFHQFMGSTSSNGNNNNNNDDDDEDSPFFFTSYENSDDTSTSEDEEVPEVQSDVLLLPKLTFATSSEIRPQTPQARSSQLRLGVSSRKSIEEGNPETASPVFDPTDEQDETYEQGDDDGNDEAETEAEANNKAEAEQAKLLQQQQPLFSPPPPPVKVESLHCAIERVSVPCRLDDLFNGVDQCSTRNWTAGMTFHVNSFTADAPTIFKIYVAPFHKKQPFPNDATIVQDKAWLAITPDDALVQNPRKAISVTLIASCCLRQVRVLAETVNHEEDECQFDFCNEGHCPASSVCTPDGQCLCPTGRTGPTCETAVGPTLAAPVPNSPPNNRPVSAVPAAVAPHKMGIRQPLQSKLHFNGQSLSMPSDLPLPPVNTGDLPFLQAPAPGLPSSSARQQQQQRQQPCAAGYLCCEPLSQQQRRPKPNAERRSYFDPFGFFECCFDGSVAPRNYCVEKNQRFGVSQATIKSTNSEALASLRAFRLAGHSSDPVNWPNQPQQTGEDVKIIPQLPKAVQDRDVARERARKAPQTPRMRNKLSSVARQTPFIAPAVPLRRLSAPTTTTTADPGMELISEAGSKGGVVMASGEQLINCNNNYFSIPGADRPFFSCCGNTLYFWLTERCQNGDTVVPRIEGSADAEKPLMTQLIPTVNGKDITLLASHGGKSASSQKTRKNIVEKLLDRILRVSSPSSTPSSPMTSPTTSTPAPKPEAVTPETTKSTIKSNRINNQVVSMVCNGAQYVVPIAQRDQLGCCGSHLYFPLTQKCKG